MSAGDDFLPFDDAAGAEYEEASDSDLEAPEAVSFDAKKISLETFSTLLARYDSTVTEVFKRKMVTKLRPKGTKIQPKKVLSFTEKSLDKAEQHRVNADLEAFSKLDQWRYTDFPALLRQRRDEAETHAEQDGNTGPDLGAYIDKGELVQLMEWKLKHGHFRPALLGMVKSNAGPVVKKTTMGAFASIPDADPETAADDAFPKVSMDTLAKALRGVGPATASLILSVWTARCDPKHEVPFYSDELYLWLCFGIFPSAVDGRIPEKAAVFVRRNGELNVKYNVSEYRRLYGAAWDLRSRLCKTRKRAYMDRTEERISMIEIEKVSFVLRHIEVSGYFPKSLQVKNAGSQSEDEDEQEESYEAERPLERVGKADTQGRKQKGSHDPNHSSGNVEKKRKKQS